MYTKDNYYPNLDSLRALACIIVILFHSSTEEFLRVNDCYNPFKGGYIGVDLFFVLSGFLITNILVRQYVGIGTIKIIPFFKRRILRLYPPIILAVIVFLVPYLFVDRNKALSNIFFVMTYTGDVVMIFRNFFPKLEYPLFFSHCWSLSIEEQFYIFFPFLLLFFFHRNQNSKTNIISTFLIYNLLFILIVLLGNFFLKAWFYKFFLWRFFQIFFGCYMALIYSKDYDNGFESSISVTKIKEFTKKIIENKYFFLATFLFFISTISFYLPFNLLGLQSYLITIASASLIINAIYGNAKWYISLLSNKSLRYIGRISYGLYLYHYPALSIKSLLGVSFSGSLLYSVISDIITLFVVFIMATLSYKYVEKPLLSLKNKIT